MRLLHAGVDTSVIALWLGHEDIGSTQMYLRADLTIKERALARTALASVSPGRYRAADPLLAFLEGLLLCRPPQWPELAEARLVGISRNRHKSNRKMARLCGSLSATIASKASAPIVSWPSCIGRCGCM